MSNDRRKEILLGFNKLGHIRDVTTYADARRNYTPQSGVPIGLYLERADANHPVSRVSDVPAGTALSRVSAGFVEFPPDAAVRPWVGVLLLQGGENFRNQLMDRRQVQFQAFEQGLIAIPSPGRDFLLEDRGNDARLLAITMTEAGGEISTVLHWQIPGAASLLLDSWNWPDRRDWTGE